MTPSEPASQSAPTLSVVKGGPAFAVLKRLRLVQEERMGEARRIALILALVSWLPLAALSFAEGYATGGIEIPFFYDFEPHVRFLFALPLLVFAEIPIGERLAKAIAHFATSGLVADEDRDRFAAIVAKTASFRDSWIATVALLLIVLAAETYSVTNLHLVHAGTWIAPVSGGNFSWAGYWYAIVGLPIFQFVLARWSFRLIVWGRFLADMAGMNLRLTPTHPDRAGGLAFLGRTIVPFGIVGLALSSVLAARIAPRVMFGHENIFAEATAFGFFILLAILIAIAPLLFFVSKLHHLKQRGLNDYGALATSYTQAFHARWITHEAPADEPLLGTGDIQSLADLANAFDVIKKMNVLPVTKENLISLVAPILLPIIPLTATVVPLDEIFKVLLRVVA